MLLGHTNAAKFIFGTAISQVTGTHIGTMCVHTVMFTEIHPHLTLINIYSVA